MPDSGYPEIFGPDLAPVRAKDLVAIAKGATERPGAPPQEDDERGVLGEAVSMSTAQFAEAAVTFSALWEFVKWFQAEENKKSRGAGRPREHTVAQAALVWMMKSEEITASRYLRYGRGGRRWRRCGRCGRRRSRWRCLCRRRSSRGGRRLSRWLCSRRGRRLYRCRSVVRCGASAEQQDHRQPGGSAAHRGETRRRSRSQSTPRPALAGVVERSRRVGVRVSYSVRLGLPA